MDQVSFEVWRERLREDCLKLEKVQAFHNMGDAVLRLLYESGVDPSVRSIVDSGGLRQKSAS
jgi:hypothetical protein